MDIYTYTKNRISEKAADIIGSQIDLDDYTERTWFNPYTGVVLSNYALLDFFRSEEDFKYIDFSFDDNFDDTYTVRIATNFGGYREYVLGMIEWDDIQGVYVLWTGAGYSESDSGLQNSSVEGVSYSSSLQETEDNIKDDIIDNLINDHQ